MIAFLLGQLLCAILAVFAVWQIRRVPGRWENCSRTLDGHGAVGVAALLSGGVTWFVWRSLNDVPVVGDELAYVLQAKLFAHGAWTAPAAPLPAFFEQFNIFVDPVVASKYPPGHSLVITPGFWLDLPGLVPVLLVAASGALVFALARRLANQWVGVMTFSLWLLEMTGLRFHSSYFSENTTSLCWLLGFWSLLEWRENKQVRWLTLLTACVAWGGITRPATMLAYAIPMMIVVLWTIAQRRAWSTMIPAMAVGLMILGVLLVGNVKVTGNWSSLPWNVWAQEYMPWDAPGFGFDDTPPRRELPHSMMRMVQDFGSWHEAHTVARLPELAWNRLVSITESSLGSWRQPDVRILLSPFALMGVFMLGWGRPVREGRLGLACSIALFGVYLSYAHPPDWTLYYLESSWLLPFASALGLWTVFAMVARRTWHPTAQLLRESPALPAMATAALIGALVFLAIPRLDGARHHMDVSHATHRSWQDFLETEIPYRRAIVFVRYSPTHYVHESLVFNDPDLASARLWLVHDRGPENAKLARLAPDRDIYLFDEQEQTLELLERGRVQQ